MGNIHPGMEAYCMTARAPGRFGKLLALGKKKKSAYIILNSPRVAHENLELKNTHSHYFPGLIHENPGLGRYVHRLWSLFP